MTSKEADAYIAEVRSEHIAHARLRGAAPDMLAALQGAVADYEARTHNTHGMALRWVVQARAAIAKATG
jgi:hypothetical protein